MKYEWMNCERRISQTTDGTRYRVQYTKAGKAQAKILTSLEEARLLRDATDRPEIKKMKKKGSYVEPIVSRTQQTTSPATEPEKASNLNATKLQLINKIQDQIAALNAQIEKILEM